MRLKASAASLISLAIIGLASPVLAATPPKGGRLSFDVIRNGSDIGQHVFTFTGSSSDFEVDVSTDIAVRIPLIRTKVYSYEQKSEEQWKGGQLVHVTSRTDNDGKKNSIDQPVDHLLPGSLWSADTVTASKLVNTIDGSTMRVQVADMGTETISASGASIPAHHYRITGDLSRDVWYDGRGYLAQLALTADDGSKVTYVRK